MCCFRIQPRTTHIRSHRFATVMQNHAEQSTDHAVYLYKSNSTQSHCKHQTALLMAEYPPYQGMPSHSSTVLMAEYPPYQGMPSQSSTLLMAECLPYQGMPSQSRTLLMPSHSSKQTPTVSSTLATLS